MVDDKNKATPSVSDQPPSMNQYDSPASTALRDFMVTNWATQETNPITLVEGVSYFYDRRSRLSKMFPESVLVIPSGCRKRRSNDTFFRFRAGSNFYYLTGSVEEDSVLVLFPKAPGAHCAVLYVEPSEPHGARAFQDRNKGELWAGRRLGLGGSRIRYGIDEVRELSLFGDDLAQARVSGLHKCFLLQGIDPKVDALCEGRSSSNELGATLAEMRMIKDDFELCQLSRAITVTKTAFEDVIKALPELASERDVEGIFNLRARREGNDVGFPTIAASGAHACVIHWNDNNGPLNRDELLLLDAAIELDTLYTSDITRTLPMSGHFSNEQREVYQLVLDAQQAALLECKPGLDFMAPTRAAMRVLAFGLERLGVLRIPADEALRAESQLYRRYTLHNAGHMLGLDVHDCSDAPVDVYANGILKPGMVITVEPGLYFQPDDLTVPARFRGIGIRIEDDVAITSSGHAVLSFDIPRTIEDVERWIQSLWTK